MQFKIAGYPVAYMKNRGLPWQFALESGFVPTRATPSSSGVSEHLYLSTAGALRRRLNSAGYDRKALEFEYLKYMDQVFSRWDPPYFFRDDKTSNTTTAVQRAEAFRFASLDDWFFALKMAIRFRNSGHLVRAKHIEYSDPFIDINALVDIVMGPESLPSSIKLPSHVVGGFPCISVECMALAMLEVVPDDAECVLDVFELVPFSDDLTSTRENAV
ncbi:HEPN/Toprim-associated domain-containing protein [Burkholderia sp. Bp9004]|uniref:HEPN/Toprim-associated domain-containing protein n=1 Tax=Burkholderia sp. Bp9004 TaxID=2184559 RepID=UPI000F5E7CB7|nr:HEPN/Toprim-associated domain-containing protein [Burkholderia sp. Bp9004]